MKMWTFAQEYNQITLSLSIFFSLSIFIFMEISRLAIHTYSQTLLFLCFQAWNDSTESHCAFDEMNRMWSSTNCQEYGSFFSFCGLQFLNDFSRTSSDSNPSRDLKFSCRWKTSDEKMKKTKSFIFRTLHLAKSIFIWHFSQLSQIFAIAEKFPRSESCLHRC